MLNKKLHRVLSLEPRQALRINTTVEQAESVTRTSKQSTSHQSVKPTKENNMTIFEKTMHRANVLGNIADLINNHSNILYSTKTDENGNLVPWDEEDAYRMGVVQEVHEALEKLL